MQPGPLSVLTPTYSVSISEILQDTAAPSFGLYWAQNAAAACRLSGIAPEVVRREGY